MDELAARCQQQLATFRIKELRDVLTRIGVAKQGKKQILLDKIMTIIFSSERQHPGHKGPGLKPGALSNKYAVNREELAKVIDDIYRKMHGSSAADLASKIGNAPAISNSLAHSDNQDEVLNWGESKTRCPCGSSVDVGTMIQCDGASCGVWQHINCVVISEKEDMEPAVPLQFYCECCRIQQGDPFCVALSHPLLPTKLSMSTLASEGSSPLQNIEKSFVLSRTDREILHHPSHDLQVWCILLNDKVPFRMHWPAFTDLRVNGVSVRVTNRPGQQLLGANGRDDGPGIIACTREGTNRISLSAYDSRPFCIGIRIIRHLTMQQVLSLIPCESEGESFDAALSRARRCIGGGGLGNCDGDDSDLEVVSESVTVNLRCPMSGSRMKVAGRFKPCVHMGCFDLHAFVELNQRTRKWQCPICMKNYSLENLIIDPFFNQITRSMKGYSEDVTEIEMKPDGFWRPKLEGDEKAREPWRSPNGSISLANSIQKVSTQQESLKAVKVEEGLSIERMPLKLGMKRTKDGLWKLNGARDFSVPGRNQMQNNRVISRSSSATASNDEDPSVNQESSDHINHYRRDEGEVNSIILETMNVWQADGPASAEPDLPRTSEVIVLSDTEEENVDDFILGSTTGTVFGGRDMGQVSIRRLHSPATLTQEAQSDCNGLGLVPVTGDLLENTTERLQSFTQEDVEHTAVGTPLDFLGSGGGDLPLPAEKDNYWDLPSQTAPFEFFGSDISCGNPNNHCGQLCPIPAQAIARPVYGLSPQHQRENSVQGTGFVDYTGPVGGSQAYLAADSNGDAAENTRDLHTADSSLRLFLPEQPSRSSLEPSLHEPLVPSPEGIQEDWFSLSLGGSENQLNMQNNTTSSFQEGEQPDQERGHLDSLVNTASVLLGMGNAARQPALQKSSHVQRNHPDLSGYRPINRSRYYFRVDSDSE
eukprot:c29064_g1_i1 orf=658-3456(-)